MNKIKKLFGYLAMGMGFMLLSMVSVKAVQQLDAFIDAGGVNVKANGRTMWRVGSRNPEDLSFVVANSSAASSGNGVPTYTIIISTNGNIMVNANEGAFPDGAQSGFQIGPGLGGANLYGLRLATATAAQIGNSTPGNTGELVFNATNKILCISTGTAKGAYGAAVSTSATTLSGGIPATNTSWCY